MTCTVCLLGVCLVPWAAAGPSYARPELLVAPAQLAAAKGFLVLDVRAAKDYDEGHVPGALRVDHDAWKKAFGDGRDAQDWSKRIGQMGITADSTVVAYDDKDSNEAARIWWILRYWGVKDVRLLNGGLQGWQAAQLPVNTAPAKATATKFVATPHADRLATKQQILQRLKSGQWQLVDARSEGEYCEI